MSFDSPGMTSFGLAPRFPAVRLDSWQDFQAFRRDHQDTLDGRYRYEQTLATKEKAIVKPGTCAPCLATTAFHCSTAGGEAVAGGKIVPNWREEMLCGCADRLTNRARALIHFVQSCGVPPWAHMLLFGPPGSADRRLAALVARSTVAPALTRTRGGAWRIPIEDQSCHIAVSQDFLHRIPPLEAALAELFRILLPGGSLMFSVPFQVHARDSSTDAAFAGQAPSALPASSTGQVHALGWDMLDRLRGVGFRDATAHLYWSEELGYLGPFNFLFRTMR